MHFRNTLGLLPGLEESKTITQVFLQFSNTSFSAGKLHSKYTGSAFGKVERKSFFFKAKIGCARVKIILDFFFLAFLFAFVSFFYALSKWPNITTVISQWLKITQKGLILQICNLFKKKLFTKKGKFW